MRDLLSYLDISPTPLKWSAIKEDDPVHPEWAAHGGSTSVAHGYSFYVIFDGRGYDLHVSKGDKRVMAIDRFSDKAKPTKAVAGSILSLLLKT